eukprot:scaffold123226_cov75-Phaeocystis_antarctica.AAC.3
MCLRSAYSRSVCAVSVRAVPVPSGSQLRYIGSVGTEARAPGPLSPRAQRLPAQHVDVIPRVEEDDRLGMCCESAAVSAPASPTERASKRRQTPRHLVSPTVAPAAAGSISCPFPPRLPSWQSEPSTPRHHRFGCRSQRRTGHESDEPRRCARPGVI